MGSSQTSHHRFTDVACRSLTGKQDICAFVCLFFRLYGEAILIKINTFFALNSYVQAVMSKAPRLLTILLGLPLLLTPLQASPQCRLCTADEQARQQERSEASTPLRVVIEADIKFSRLALNGSSGEARLDENSGITRTDGGLINLGGLSLTGSARVTGEPGRAVRIDLPDQVRMVNQTGDPAELTNLRTNLPAHPRLNQDGALSFRFSGTLRVNSASGGNYRGRIPITAEYE